MLTFWAWSFFWNIICQMVEKLSATFQIFNPRKQMRYQTHQNLHQIPVWIVLETLASRILITFFWHKFQRYSAKSQADRQDLLICQSYQLPTGFQFEITSMSFSIQVLSAFFWTPGLLYRTVPLAYRQPLALKTIPSSLVCT